ncbi:hypothetical protein [Amycolatopsis japonica]|uniref:hypothetical protein n=1 Tax=Amycolatopsis japonica TaxID=208439 RepID=UPI0037FC3426
MEGLTAAEERVREAFDHGTRVEFGGDDSAGGKFWGPERTIRAKFLRNLLLGSSSSRAALRLAGARITGELDMRNAAIQCPVVLYGCYFAKAPNFYAAQTRQLAFTKSALPGLIATEIRTSGALQLSMCQISGTVRLVNADLGALALDGAVITVDGEAVQLNPARITSDLTAIGLQVSGEVRLDGLRVDGVLNLEKSTLHRPTGTALRAIGCRAAELRLAGAAAVEGEVDLRRAHFEAVDATPGVWPGAVRLDGFTYEALTPRLPADDRLKLLARDADGYVPHAYEQLAAAYARLGDDRSARDVRLAKQRRHRATLPGYAQVWGYAQDVTVGYGYRPMRAAAWLAALLLLGVAVFGLHQPPPIDAAKAPGYNPVFYPLDLLVPIVDFGQAKAFAPQGWYQWLSYGLVATGWLLATTMIAGVTRTINRS